jgi:hypothetical protein
MVIGKTPVPVRVAVKGLPSPEYMTVIVPVCAPAVVGLKVALIVQVEFAATDAQLLVCANGVAGDEIVRAVAVVE